jgi:hypothetical protein
MRHGVLLAEIFEQRGERRELAADGGAGEGADLEGLAPGDDVGAGDQADLAGGGEAGEAQEVGEVDPVGPAGSSLMAPILS